MPGCHRALASGASGRDRVGSLHPVQPVRAGLRAGYRKRGGSMRRTNGSSASASISLYRRGAEEAFPGRELGGDLEPEGLEFARASGGSALSQIWTSTRPRSTSGRPRFVE